MGSKKLQLLIVLIIVIIIGGIVFAQDTNTDTNTPTTSVCASVGEPYSTVYTEYPSACCSGLTAWASGMDSRIVKEGQCVETGLLKGAPVGTCLKCGDGVCEGKETICNCPTDCPPTNSEQICGTMSYSKAKLIALNSCGEITGNYSCNEGTATWWFDLAKKKAGCKPACVINVNTGAAEINWRCTGLIEPSIPECTADYSPVCAQIEKTDCPTPICTDSNCQSGGTCTTEMVKKTYSNSCVAKSNGAEFLYEGECGSPVKPKPECGAECENVFAPVCGGKKICATSCSDSSSQSSDSSATTNCTTSCYEDKKTYMNKCQAKCGGVEVLYEGECKKDCTEDSDCKLTTICPDGGSFAQVCQDSKCVWNQKCSQSPQNDFYKFAEWKCSNGTEFNEGSESTCMPYAYWKELARRKCANMSTNCTSNSTTSGGSSSSANPITNAVGNFLLQIVGPQPTSTVATASVTNTTTPISATSSSTTSTSVTCIGGDVYVTAFSVQEPCSNDCNSYLDDTGCKVIACGNQEAKRVCPQTCINQPYEEIKQMKDECYAKGGDVRVEMSENDCTSYNCVPADSNECKQVSDIPNDKYDICESNGGKLLTKTNAEGCLVYVECVGATTDTNASINKKLLNDKTKLLDLALQLETLKLELNKTADKTQALADYYTSKGDTNTAAKFTHATELLKLGVTKVDAVKAIIRDNVSNFTEENALAVREGIRNIREVILNEVLMTLLE